MLATLLHVRNMSHPVKAALRHSSILGQVVVGLPDEISHKISNNVVLGTIHHLYEIITYIMAAATAPVTDSRPQIQITPICCDLSQKKRTFAHSLVSLCRPIIHICLHIWAFFFLCNLEILQWLLCFGHQI